MRWYSRPSLVPPFDHREPGPRTAEECRAAADDPASSKMQVPQGPAYVLPSTDHPAEYPIWETTPLRKDTLDVQAARGRTPPLPEIRIVKRVRVPSLRRIRV